MAGKKAVIRGKETFLYLIVSIKIKTSYCMYEKSSLENGWTDITEIT